MVSCVTLPRPNCHSSLAPSGQPRHTLLYEVTLHSQCVRATHTPGQSELLRSGLKVVLVVRTGDEKGYRRQRRPRVDFQVLTGQRLPLPVKTHVRYLGECDK